jgi:hypothetical protein
MERKGAAMIHGKSGTRKKGRTPRALASAELSKVRGGDGEHTVVLRETILMGVTG